LKIDLFCLTTIEEDLTLMNSELMMKMVIMD